MKFLKRLWQMTRDKRYTCRLIAAGCVPLTFYNVMFLSPSANWSSANWSLAMVGLNLLMWIIAVTETDDD